MTICSFKKVSSTLTNRQNLSNISLTIEPQEVIAVLGNNGSGKSELAQLLQNTLPFQGEASFPQSIEIVSFERIQEIINEDDIEADITEATLLNPGLCLSDLILRESGLVPTINSSSFNQQNPLIIAQKKQHLPHLHSLLNEFDLEDKKGLAIRHLSTGEMQKALLIAAIIKQPALLLLDEPFDGLDVHSRQTLVTLLASPLLKESALILFLNRVDEIPTHTNTLLFLDSGTITLQGDAQDLIQSPQFAHLVTLTHALPQSLPGEHRIHSPKLNSNGELVTLAEVTIKYGSDIVLNSINLSISPGEHFQISGPNGCGKSTLLSIISGDHPQSFINDITLFGYRRGSGETLWDIKREVGIVSTLLQRDYKVGGSVLSVILSGFNDSIGLYAKSSALEQAEALQWLEVLQMTHYAKKSFRTLSYGEQRMILIARAMVKRPALLVLDEPTLGLDSINRQLLLQLVSIIGLKSKTTILYVTHHSEDVIPAITKRITFVKAQGGGYTLEIY